MGLDMNVKRDRKCQIMKHRFVASHTSKIHSVVVHTPILCCNHYCLVSILLASVTHPWPTLPTDISHNSQEIPYLATSKKKCKLLLRNCLHQPHNHHITNKSTMFNNLHPMVTTFNHSRVHFIRLELLAPMVALRPGAAPPQRWDSQGCCDGSLVAYVNRQLYPNELVNINHHVNHI